MRSSSEHLDDGRAEKVPLTLKKRKVDQVEKDGFQIDTERKNIVLIDCCQEINVLLVPLYLNPHLNAAHKD